MTTLLSQSHLKTWQQCAVEMLVKHRHMLLGAQPGSGKTITTLTALDQIGCRALLVAPAIILDTVWELEAQRWSHTNHLVFNWAHRLSGRDRSDLWFYGKGDLVTITPDTLIKFLDQVNQRELMPVGQLIVDESQAFKNATAVRTAALHALAEHVPTWLLSGTPVPNGAVDCWSPGRILSRQGAFWQ
jgi:SNF2 family DNA or RNA helicase